MTIGNRIKIVRESEGLSQRDFAVSIKIGQSTLAMFETGQREPKDIHIEQICSKYRINEHWLRTNEGEMHKSLPPEDEVAAVVSDLLEEDNPFYDLIIGIMKTYQKLDNKSKDVLKNLSKELLDNIGKRED